MKKRGGTRISENGRGERALSKSNPGFREVVGRREEEEEEEEELTKEKKQEEMKGEEVAQIVARTTNGDGGEDIGTRRRRC